MREDKSKTMRPTTSFHLNYLATECTDPIRAGLEMKSTMKSLLKRNRSLQTCNLLEKLIKKKIGTNGAEKNAARIEKDGKKRNGKQKRNVGMIVSIMKDKLRDAKEDYRILD